MSAPRVLRLLPRAANRFAIVSRSASTSTTSTTAVRTPSRPATASAKKTAAAASASRIPSPTSAASRPIHATTRSAAAARRTPATPADATAAATLSTSETSPLPDATGPALGPAADPNVPPVDWSSSFHGLSTTRFSAEAAEVLMTPIDPQDIEIKPDGILYLPEIKYRRILNMAFGPGGWGLAPRGELAVGEKVVSREYALVVQGRYVAEARGECPYFGGEDGVATAGEGSKSNAMMRCCKDLGVASELWDPRFIRQFKQEHCREVWVEHVTTKKKRQIWLRKDCSPAYPYALPAGTASRTVR
ncbi:hypothetical protein SCUCBS95973_001836 [Sporothrix curviconia]|uniref:Mitochondrial genome maintenance protein MGM101 n=1 Tax=Sporothrix curviconia TaxID=1260050 RepID=A0ABP0B2F4_9PEZI